MNVRPKKHLGQHFLIDQSILSKTIESIDFNESSDFLEIGPGTGALTKELVKKTPLTLVEIDQEAANYIENNFGSDRIRLLNCDFLKLDLELFQTTELAIVGNFPYNISSQIVFKIYDNHSKVNQMVGMFQKEVAQRICSTHGNKNYGILSVLIQCLYDVEYLFEIPPESFNPPPKVVSAVIKLRRKNKQPSIALEAFRSMVKQAFGQRRKKLSNSLKSLEFNNHETVNKLLNLRAEQLSVDDFVYLFHQQIKP